MERNRRGAAQYAETLLRPTICQRRTCAHTGPSFGTRGRPQVICRLASTGMAIAGSIGNLCLGHLQEQLNRFSAVAVVAVGRVDADIRERSRPCRVSCLDPTYAARHVAREPTEALIFAGILSRAAHDRAN